MTRRLLGVALLLLAAACGQPPVRDEVTIEFNDQDRSLSLTAQTTLDLRADAASARVDAARKAVQAETDAWSARFARVTPEADQVLYHRTGGVLDRVTRSARIQPDDLQRVFSDVAVTIDINEGEGWRELVFYPGSSTRASREQRRRFDEDLLTWSSDVTRYFTAMHHFYSYMNDAPQRAPYLFAALFDDQNPVTEDEQPLVQAVREAMEQIATRMDAQENESASFAETADLIFNPFPARIVVRVPGDILVREGFTESRGNVTIEPVDLLAAVAALEGRWISPDPLALLLQDKNPTAEELAELPRNSTPVISTSEVTSALRAQLARPKQYVVRWRD